MKTQHNPSDSNPVAQETPRRYLDPTAELRDCANQWDVSELWQAPATRNERKPNRISPTGKLE